MESGRIIHEPCRRESKVEGEGEVGPETILNESRLTFLWSMQLDLSNRLLEILI